MSAKRRSSPRNLPTAERLVRWTDRSGGPDACWLWTGTRTAFGYGKLGVRSATGGRRGVRAHRVAYELAHGPIPEGLCVLHRCDNPACCNPAHLSLGTQADNMRDMAAKGRHYARVRPERVARGARVAGAKLTEATVREMRAAHAVGAKPRELAAKYNVAPSSVRRLLERESWAHVA